MNRAPLCLSVIGARPQFIKAAIIARAMAQRPAKGRPAHRLIHTGQHFDAEMSAVFFRDLDLPKPAHQLRLGGLPPSVQLGRMVERLSVIYRRERPDVILVYGDTTSTLGGALAAALERIPVAHIEAGLRSFNRRMPEETNRVLTDHLSRWLFCPSRTSVQHLKREGIVRGVHLVGDVMVDALQRMGPVVRRRQDAALNRWRLAAGRYYLATLHRTENTTEAQTVIRLLEMFSRLELPTLLPLHPRTRNLLKRAGWRAPSSGNLRVVRPLPYQDMLVLERGAKAILTDSGGVQKEAYFWGVPCVTLRQETEWVETLRGGWNRLAGTQPRAVHAALASLGGAVRAPRPRLYGDGQAGAALVDRLLEELKPKTFRA